MTVRSFKNVASKPCITFHCHILSRWLCSGWRPHSKLDIDSWGHPRWLSGKESACQCRLRHRFDLWVGKIPWRKKIAIYSSILVGKSHGQRILLGYNPQGCKESDTTEATQLSTSTYLLNCHCLLNMHIEKVSVSYCPCSQVEERGQLYRYKKGYIIPLKQKREDSFTDKKRGI